MPKEVSNKKVVPLKAPPQNLEAEQATLGGILIDPEGISKAIEIFDPDGSDFYSPVHTKIYQAMVALYENNTPIDAITLKNYFGESNALDSVGGISYIIELTETTPTAANLFYYARIVKGKSLLRKVIDKAAEITRMGFEGVDDIDTFIDDAERLIFEVSQEKISKKVYKLKDIIKDTFETIEKLYEQKTHITGVPSGFSDLDSLTAGFQASDLIIAAGRPSMGKTAFCLNIAENVAINENIPVAVFSLEMSKEQLVQRLLASRAKVGLGRIRNGHLKEEDWGKLTNAVGTLYEAPIFIDDSAAQTVLEIRAKARRWKMEHNIGLVIIDYLQLLKGRRGIDSREQEISDISRSLKALAKELNIPVMALSQLSRKTEQRPDGRPMLSDLRESGAIEQDADIVMFVYRESVYNDCDCPKELCTCGRRNTAEIMVSKQRNGPTGDVKLTFLREFTRFEDQSNFDYGGEDAWVE